MSSNLGLQISQVTYMRGSRGGGGGGSGSGRPEKSQKYKVSLQYWSGLPAKSQSYQANNQ